MATPKSVNRYTQLIEAIFLKHYQEGLFSIDFDRSEITETAKIGVVQIEQDMAVCATKFPSLICRPLAAQFMSTGVIAMFEFEQVKNEIKVTGERHYRLVGPDDLSPEDIAQYRNRLT